MKILTTLSLFLCFLCTQLVAQTGSTAPSLIEHASPDHGISREIATLAQQVASDPGYAETEWWMQQYLEAAQQKKAEFGNALPDTSCILTIPIVFHVFHPNGSAGVPFSQIDYAMQDLNRTFAGADADYLTVNAAFDGVKSYTRIRFALAKIDPKGNPTNGIVYYQDRQSGFGNGWGYDPQIASCAWDNYKYFNVYIMHDLYANNVTNNSGIAWYPSTFMSDYKIARVVYNYVYFGYGGSSYNNLDFNQTFTHECGHYLHLIHTFEGGNCASAGDQCADTPPTDVAGAGCNAVRCGGLINGENYMDYNTSCYKNFTMDQNTRMEAALTSPSRQPLWQYDNLVATGLLDPKSEHSCVMAQAFFAYSKTKLVEDIANDGSIEMPPVIIYACGGAEFALQGAPLQEGLHYTISNIPAGLSTSIVSAADGKSATLTLVGIALQHDAANSISNIILTFSNEAVVGSNAANILNYTSTFNLTFLRPWRTICSTETLTTTENSSWNQFETTGPIPRYYGLWYNAGSYYLENYGRGIITTSVNSDNIQFLSAGAAIGATSPWRMGGNQGVLFAPNYPDLNNQTGYVGFRMQAGKDFFYGWMLISVSSTNGITLLEYQYNEKPNEPILAGALPLLTVNNTVVCAGESATLMVAGAPNFVWSNGATTSTITVNPSVSTTYTVTGTNPGCPDAQAMAEVTVNPLPLVSVNSPGICEGQTATLIASGAETYLWSTGATGDSIGVSPVASATYTVTGVLNGCSSDPISAVVTVQPLPILTLNNPNICEGQTATLIASGAETYLWSTGANGDSIGVSPVVSATYTVTGVLNGCASDPISAVVTVQALPILTLNNPNICEGQTATLIADGAETYLWSTGATGVSIGVSPVASTTYTVTGVLNGCSSDPISAVVTVQPLPILTLNNPNICEGQTATLIASGAETYLWSTGATGVSIGVSPVVSATYTVTGVLNGCASDPVSAVVTVQALPIITLNNPIICEGQTATLIASGAEIYLWSTGATGVSIGVSPVVSATYTVTGVMNGCASDPVSAEVLVDALPSDSILVSGNTLTAFEPNGSYQWLNCINNNWMPNATDQAFTPSLDGNYAVIITNGACVDTSTCISVLVSGIPRLFEESDVCISPNPTSGIFRVELNHSIENLSLRIYNARGQCIHSEAYSSTRLVVIDLSEYSAGCYIVQIMAEGKFYNTSVFKQ